MAAVPASPPNPENYFEVMGVPERFHQDLKDLETRFYRLSREFHPDRFSTASTEAKQESLRKMSLINEAYQTLRNPDLLREYVLERAELLSQVKPQLPQELAEEWFELQDVLMENPAEARSRLRGFEEHLSELKKRGLKDLEDLERVIDSKGVSEARPELAQLAKAFHAQSYLVSMERDVERIKGRL